MLISEHLFFLDTLCTDTTTLILDKIYFKYFNNEEGPDGHGAEDVEEYEAAVRHVVPGQITMTDSLALTLF